MIFSMMVLIFCAFFVEVLPNKAELVTIRKNGGAYMYLQEKGVKEPSVKFFETPSAMARELFLYVTRRGDFYVSNDYYFHFRSETGREESHQFSFMLFAVLEGAMHVEAGNRKYVVDAGECTMMDCREPHVYYSDTDTRFLWIHFDGIDARRFYEYIMRVHTRPPFVLPYEEFAEDLRRLIHSDGVSNESERSQVVYRLLCSLAVTPENKTREEPSAVMLAMDYMQRHLLEPLSVAEVAEFVHMSPSHFSRLFRQEAGYAPHEYLVVLRLNHAKHLLVNTEQTVRQIAFASGYNSEGNFIKSFVEKVGVTPTQFRGGM